MSSKNLNVPASWTISLMKISKMTVNKSSKVRSKKKQSVTSFCFVLCVDLEKKLDAERMAVKRANEDLIQTQKKVRILEIDLKQITTNYNQLIYDHQLSKQSNEQIIEQMESDNQRRTQYDKDFKQLQQQLQNSLNKEKQFLNEIHQMKKENDRLQDELKTLNVEYENVKTKIIDYEEQVEGLLNSIGSFKKGLSSYLVESKFSVLYRTQMNELKDEINELTDKLRQVTHDQTSLEEERDNLLKQLEITNVKLKTESLNLNLLQKQCAELEKEKNIMIIEVEALHTDFNGRLALLDSEINTVSDPQRTIFKFVRLLFFSSSEIDMKNVNTISNRQLKIVMQCRINFSQLSIVCLDL